MSQTSSTITPRLESFFKRLPAGTHTSCTARPSSKPGSLSAPVRRKKWPVGRKWPVGQPRKEPAEPEIIVLDSSNSEESELEELSGAGIPAAATPVEEALRTSNVYSWPKEGRRLRTPSWCPRSRSMLRYTPQEYPTLEERAS